MSTYVPPHKRSVSQNKINDITKYNPSRPSKPPSQQTNTNRNKTPSKRRNRKYKLSNYEANKTRYDDNIKEQIEENSKILSENNYNNHFPSLNVMEKKKDCCNCTHDDGIVDKEHYILDDGKNIVEGLMKTMSNITPPPPPPTPELENYANCLQQSCNENVNGIDNKVYIEYNNVKYLYDPEVKEGYIVLNKDPLKNRANIDLEKYAEQDAYDYYLKQKKASLDYQKILNERIERGDMDLSWLRKDELKFSYIKTKPKRKQNPHISVSNKSNNYKGSNDMNSTLTHASTYIDQSYYDYEDDDDVSSDCESYSE